MLAQPPALATDGGAATQAWIGRLFAAWCLTAAGLTACGAPARSAAPGASPPAQPIPSAQSIPSALLSAARPVGTGIRFQPPVSGPVYGSCTAALGPRSGVHVEVFASNRVLLVPAGIGTRAPRDELDGRIVRAGCYGALVTLDPTGVVLVRPGGRLTLADLFRSWGAALSASRLASFSAAPGSGVAVYVDGKRWTGAPAAVPLSRHAEIVLEVGPHVPPHSAYTFPPGS